MFIKMAQKIGIVVKTALFGYGNQRIIAWNEFLGQHNPAVKHVIIDTAICILFERMRQVGNTDPKTLGKFIHPNRLNKVLVNISLNTKL